MMADPRPHFDPDFAGNAEWAAMYRAAGLQVIPARYPMRDKTDKRPALASWREFQEAPIADGLFAAWFTPQATPNMGLITGRASGNTFVIDLDDHADRGAGFWWQAALEVNNDGLDLETWRQITGGGGRQLFFRAPPDWHAPTNRTPIGVDIRGQGGFAMLPPSVHLSGKEYRWAEGCAPWECELLDAPQWLLDAVDALVEQFGGDQARGAGERAERAPSAAADFDPFGARVDGREDALTRWVWRSVLELHRSSGGVMPEDGGAAHIEASIGAWCRNTKTRLRGVDNTLGLERECRGPSAFRAKWARAITKWDSLVARQAADRREQSRPFGDETAGPDPSADFSADTTAQAKTDRFLFETVADLRCLPPTAWLVKNWIPVGGFGIFYGKWAAGKSFVGFDLALHLSYGMTDWHGADLPAEPVDVLVLAREGHAGFVGRVDAFKRHYGVVDDTDRLVFMRAAVSFMRDEEFGALCEAIRRRGTRFGLVVVDTVARVLPGVDMNEQQTVTLFTERCAILGEITGASVIGVHHENKNGGMMGSAYFEANADFVFEISRLGGEDEPLREGEILCTKMKDGEDRWRRAVSYKKVGLSDIDPEPASLVVERIKESSETAQAKSKWPEKDVCRQILAAVEEGWRKGGAAVWSDSPQSGARFAAKIINTRWRVGAGLARQMVETWLINGVLSVEERDSKSKLRGLKVVGSID